MATSRSGSSGISESTIVFYNGGHSHDGISSSLIDTDEYSIYDWTVGYVGSGSRLSRQVSNFNSLKNVIADIVTDTVLGPSGIRLSPNTLHAISIVSNTITADQIAANTITASELSANIILVNQVIKSNNYSAGVSGWAINGNGTAEFGSASIRGSVQAGSLYINALNYWNSNGIFSVGEANNVLFYNGTDLELTGKVTATSGQIAGWVIDADNLETGGNYAGSMIIGQFAESNGGGGVKIEGAAAGGQFGTAIFTGDLLSFANTALANTVSISRSGIKFGLTNQTWQFYESGGALHAVVDGTQYCLSLCGSAPAPVGVSPVTVVGTTVVGTTVVGTTVVGTTVVVGETVTTVVGETVTTVVGEPVTVVVGGPAGCSPPCPQDFICFSGYCIG